MLLELNKFLHICPHTFKTFYYQYKIFRRDKFFSSTFFQNAVYSAKVLQLFVIHVSLNWLTYLLGMEHTQRFYFCSSNILKLLFCKMFNCLKGVGKEEIITKDVQLFNQIDLDKLSYNYMKSQEKVFVSLVHRTRSVNAIH